MLYSVIDFIVNCLPHTAPSLEEKAIPNTRITCISLIAPLRYIPELNQNEVNKVQANVIGTVDNYIDTSQCRPGRNFRPNFT